MSHSWIFRGYADHSGPPGDIMNDYRVGTDLGARADSNWPNDPGPRSYGDVPSDDRSLQVAGLNANRHPRKNDRARVNLDKSIDHYLAMRQEFRSA